MATAEWLQGEANLRLGRIDLAKPALESAWQRIKDRPSSDLKGNLLLSRGWLAAAEADVTKALSRYQRAFFIFKQVGDNRNQAISLLSIASLYKDAGQYDSAHKYYSQAISTYGLDPNLKVSMYNNLGNVLVLQKNFKDADIQFNEALKIARRLKSPALQAQILRNIARMDLDAGNWDASKQAINQGIAAVQGDDQQSWKTQFTAIAARVAFERGQTKESLNLIQRAFANTSEGDEVVGDRDAHETAYKIYKRVGQDDLALQHLEALKRLDDQTASLAASANTALMAARFDYTNQELKIAKLQAQELRRKIDL